MNPIAERASKFGDLLDTQIANAVQANGQHDLPSTMLINRQTVLYKAASVPPSTGRQTPVM